MKTPNALSGQHVQKSGPNINGNQREDKIREFFNGPSAHPSGQKLAGKERHTLTPDITMPKGGASLTGMGEKFDVNPVSGTCKLSVPIFTSPARSGFGPSLGLNYDSGSGNGPFGLGWQLSIPKISRRIRKGVPQYDDNIDVFLFAGIEDLVPKISVNLQGIYAIEVFTYPSYTVRRYIPRVETAFTRIERWTRTADENDVSWRTIDGDGVISTYGTTVESRISDPGEFSSSGRQNIFEWLLDAKYDSNGNAIIYEYKKEDFAGVSLTQANESGRREESYIANRYLKTIKYGNLIPNRDVQTWDIVNPSTIDIKSWMFKIVFDYGENESNTGKSLKDWKCRLDPFSSYRSGFEIRTYRLCQKILQYHCFFEELGEENCLVASTDFSYNENATFTKLLRAQRFGFMKDSPKGTQIFSQSLPPVEFQYAVAPSFGDVQPQILGVPGWGKTGTGGGHLWVDLDGDGAPGILSEEVDGSCFYRRNLCPLKNDQAGSESDFGQPRLLSSFPNFPLRRGTQLMDIDQDGFNDLVQWSNGSARGFFANKGNGNWEPFRTFPSFPSVTSHKSAKFIDLTGDGLADILVSDEQAFSWYQSLGPKGFTQERRTMADRVKLNDPRFMSNEQNHSFYMADLSGDGMFDIVCVRNGDISYFPSLGYGKFGSRVQMENSPLLDVADQFNTQRLRLADLDGSGTADILYFPSKGGLTVVRNESGNSWSDPIFLDCAPNFNSISNIDAVDLFGTGMTCLVWSSPPIGATPGLLQYLDFTGRQKSDLLTKYTNGLGVEISIKYATSTRYSLQDEQSGLPWMSKLPFPVHCVASQDTLDVLSRRTFRSRFVYHNGYYDKNDREFRGFGMVEKYNWDELGLPNARTIITPITYSKEWFHTGQFLPSGQVSRYMADQYYSPASTSGGIPYMLENLPDSVISASDAAEACRALKGHTLREENYLIDGSEKSMIPYKITETNYTSRVLQDTQSVVRYPVFLVEPREKIECQLDRTSSSDHKVDHFLTLKVDSFGNTLKSVRFSYGRSPGMAALAGLQASDVLIQERALVTYSEHDFTNSIDLANSYRKPVSYESREYQLRGFVPSGSKRVILGDLTNDNGKVLTDAAEVLFENDSLLAAAPEIKSKRKIRHSLVFFRSDDLKSVLQSGKIESLAIPSQTYNLAFTRGQRSTVYQRTRENGTVEVLLNDGAAAGGFIDLKNDGDWWAPSQKQFYAMSPDTSAQEELQQARKGFFIPLCFQDAFRKNSTVSMDKYRLFVSTTQDAIGQKTQAEYDYRALKISIGTDINGNRTMTAYDALNNQRLFAAMGKTGESKGDTLPSSSLPLSTQALEQFFLAPTESAASVILGTATRASSQDFSRYWRGVQSGSQLPNWKVTIGREFHSLDKLRPISKFFISFEYFDGHGELLQERTWVGPSATPRWLCSPRSVNDSSGRTIKEFEPFFNASHSLLKVDDATKGSPTSSLYDGQGRCVCTVNRDRTWSKIAISPWSRKTYSTGDVSLVSAPQNDADVSFMFKLYLLPQEYSPTWYEARSSSALQQDQAAAQQSKLYYNTPTITFSDPRERTFLTISDNGADGKYSTKEIFDISNNSQLRFDARGLRAQQSIANMLGQIIFIDNMDSGKRWKLPSAMNDNFLSWDSRGARCRCVYDANRRLIEYYFQDETGIEILMEKHVYGDPKLASDIASNLLGKVSQRFDQSGLHTIELADFKGNPVQIATNVGIALDWAKPKNIVLGPKYARAFVYDAASRIRERKLPDGSVIRQEYNQLGFPQSCVLNFGRLLKDEKVTPIEIVRDTEYNERNQETKIFFGNGTSTQFSYNSLTYHLDGKVTSRTIAAKPVQDLSYTYDISGRIVYIRDDNSSKDLFTPTSVDSNANYAYDAVGRLTRATGRELVVGSGPNLTPPDGSSDFQVRKFLKEDRFIRYQERYNYDAANNVQRIQHDQTDAPQSLWNRTYEYSPTNNQLLKISSNGKVELFEYAGNAGRHGNLTAMPGFPKLTWDAKDQLSSVTRLQSSGSSSPQTSQFLYDSKGNRVFKRHVINSKPQVSADTIYLGDFQIKRTYEPDTLIVAEEQEVITIAINGEQAFVVETPKIPPKGTVVIARTFRYQLTDPNLTSTLELDEKQQLISCEEYSPFGSPTYSASRTETTSPKIYGYTSKERDNNGLVYFGRRYFAPWLTRWISPDPIGITDGLNIYCYVSCDPVNYVDLDGCVGARGGYRPNYCHFKPRKPRTEIKIEKPPPYKPKSPVDITKIHYSLWDQNKPVQPKFNAIKEIKETTKSASQNFPQEAKQALSEAIKNTEIVQIIFDYFSR